MSDTPTPEQLQDAAIWLSQQNYQKEYGEQEYMMYFDVDIPIMLTAYANHVLTNHEGFQSNAELKRKLAALQEEVSLKEKNLTHVAKAWHDTKQQLIASQEQNTNLLGKLATTEQNLAISQEKVDYWVEHWNLRDVEATNLQQQLTDARKEIEGLKERMTRARSILTKDNPTSTNNWAMLDVSNNTPTA